MDCSPPGSSVHGILQARILEGVAISFSRRSSWPRNQTQVSCIAGRWFANWAMREAPSPSLEPIFQPASVKDSYNILAFWVPRYLSIVCNQSVSSVTQSCPTLCNPMDCSIQASLSITNSQSLLKLMSTESVMPSNHLILCSPLLLPPSMFLSIRVFSQWVSSSHQVAKVLKFQFQHQSFQWIFRTDFL